MRKIAFLLCALMILSVTAVAVEPDEILADPAQEARAREISKSLRCMVCQNESIDESNAQLARDLRILVRRRITEGDTNAEIVAFVHDRYGDFVLMRPPVKTRTWLLWFGPFVVLLLGGVVAWRALKTRATPHRTPDALSRAERDRLADWLRETAPPKRDDTAGES